LGWIGTKRLQTNDLKTPIERSVTNLREGSCRLTPSFLSGLNSCLGQSVVEFTLVFVLFLVIAWIPADFGLAFMTGQIASNAAREGARIGSASPTFNAATLRTETCKRLPSALLSDPGAAYGTSCSPYSNARVSASLGGSGCNQMVQVTVNGNYNFFFYQLFRLMGSSAVNNETITRQANMRWEHQC
jgi:hypothetical protein